MRRTINIGKLNKRITFKKLSEIEDEMLQEKQGLKTICTVWASFYPVRGTERYELQKIQSEISHKCYIRYRNDIDSDCFIEYKGKKYNIESAIDVDDEHKIIEILCYEHRGDEVIEDV